MQQPDNTPHDQTVEINFESITWAISNEGNEEDSPDNDLAAIIAKANSDSESSNSDFFFDTTQLIKDFRKRSFKYNENPICNITKEALLEKISAAETKYEHIDNSISENAFLWVAKKDGCAPVYIFNTAHLLTGIDPNDLFGDAFDNIIDKVDTVFTEVELSVLPENIKIALSPKLNTYVLDSFIAEKAVDMEKEVKPLENNEIREILGIDMKQYNQNWDETINTMASNRETIKYLLDHTQNYLTHAHTPPPPDSDADKKKIIDDTIGKKRNFFWMESILSESSQNKASLVICGNDHSSGKYGLPNLFAAEGYQVEPLMKTPPLSKKNMIKSLVYGSHSLGYFKPPKIDLPSNTEEENKCRALVVVPKS